MGTLRLQSSIAPETKAFVIASKPSEATTTEDFDAVDAYSRARAFFMTVAFVMISDLTFIEHKIFSLVQMTVDRRRPPPSFVAAAWDLCFNTFRRRSKPTNEVWPLVSVRHQDGHIVGRLGNQQASLKSRVFRLIAL